MIRQCGLMSNKIAIRVKPLKKWADVANMSRHGKREDPAKHVNRDRTIQNIHFSFTEDETTRSDRGEVTHNGDFGIVEHGEGECLDITEEFEALADRTGAKWRKGAIVGTEFMFLASPDFFEGERGSKERREHARKWAHDCMHEMRKKYPMQMACARLDLDEKTPHLSVFMLPTYEKSYNGPERQSKRRRAPRKAISHNQVFGTPESLSELQDWAAKAMKRQGYELARGKRKEGKGPDHTTPAEGRRLIAEAEAYAENVKAEADREAEEIKRAATPERIAALEDENERLKASVKEWKDYVASIKRTLLRFVPDEWENIRKWIDHDWEQNPDNPKNKVTRSSGLSLP